MKLSYDGKSFFIDNKRIWLHTAEIHYFRFTCGEWKEVLLRAKSAGFNTVSTYIPWNYHETNEGEFNFAGDKDIGEFIDIADALGMYVMVRPGPYVCSEWSGGGLPSWLCTKEGLEIRVDEPVYMSYCKKWFQNILPIIAKRQIIKGGPVITVQNENEYTGGWNEKTRSYIFKISDIMRECGIEVPILACNGHVRVGNKLFINYTEDKEDQIIDPNLIITYNCGGNIEPVKELQRVQPYAPVVVTELWSGEISFWGKPVRDWPSGEFQGRNIYEFASLGAQVCLYMFAGGTNFGYMAGNNIASSYAAVYPVGEGLEQNKKYYMIKPASAFVNTFGDFLSNSAINDELKVNAQDGINIVTRNTNNGNIIFVYTEKEINETSITVGGRMLDLNFEGVTGCVLPYKLKVMNVVIDYSNLCLLAKKGQAIIFYGVAGTKGTLSINGTEYNVNVEKNNVIKLDIEGKTVLIADTYMARRCWIINDDIIFGGDFATNEANGISVIVSEGNDKIIALKQGELVTKTYDTTKEQVQMPLLKQWKGEKSEQFIDWKSINKPVSHECLGVNHGYVWYKAELEWDRAEVEKLIISSTTSRVLVFVNDEFSGVFGEKRGSGQRSDYLNPTDRMFEEITVTLQKGINKFVFLSEDTGHNCDDIKVKGILGDVYIGSRMVEPKNIKSLGTTPISKDAFEWLYSKEYRNNTDLSTVEFDVDIASDEQFFIVIHATPAWVSINGVEVKPLNINERPWQIFAGTAIWSTYIGQTKEHNIVKIQYVKGSEQESLNNTQIYKHPKIGKLANWSYGIFKEDVKMTSLAHSFENKQGAEGGPVLLVPTSEVKENTTAKFIPTWFETTFEMTVGEKSVFLDIGEMQKGQIYLNGHNVCRFWKWGNTQTKYYLPRDWMKENNQLLIFEELGIKPKAVKLICDDISKTILI